MQKVSIILTGGTLAKTYEASTGNMVNADNDADRLFGDLCLDGMDVRFVDLLQKDSLDFTEEDFALILRTVAEAHGAGEKVLLICGTDRLPDLARKLCEDGAGERGVTVLTGAMVPLSVKGTDAPQNIVQALTVLRLSDAGVRTAFHNQVFDGAAVEKDREALTMVVPQV